MRKNASSTLSPVLADASMYIRPKEAKGQQCGAQVVKRGGQEPTVLLTKCGGLVVSHLSLRLQICAKAISRKSQVMYLSQREAPTLSCCRPAQSQCWGARDSWRRRAKLDSSFVPARRDRVRVRRGWGTGAGAHLM